MGVAKSAENLGSLEPRPLGSGWLRL